MKRTGSFAVLLLLGSLYSGCAPTKVPPAKGGYYYSGIYFGTHFSNEYKRGIKDGCTTAKGSYVKNHKLFNNNDDYNNGWFLGRNRCKDLLVIEEE